MKNLLGYLICFLLGASLVLYSTVLQRLDPQDRQWKHQQSFRKEVYKQVENARSESSELYLAYLKRMNELEDRVSDLEGKPRKIRNKRVQWSNRSSNALKGAAAEAAMRSQGMTIPPPSKPLPSFCTYALVNIYSDGKWTERFSHEYFKWTENVLMRGLDAQTYRDFENIVGPTIGPRAPGTPTSQFHVTEGSWKFGKKLNELVKNRTCEWIWTGRIDADDFVEPRWMERALSLFNETWQEERKPDLAGVMVSHPFHRMVEMDVVDGKLKCAWSNNMNLSDKASAIGLTIFIRRDVFERANHFNAQSADRGRMIDGLRKVIAPRHLRWEWKHFERDYGMYLNTKLSGHFYHWTSQNKLPNCKVKQLQKLYDFDISPVLNVSHFPSPPVLDACLSNKHWYGVPSDYCSCKALCELVTRIRTQARDRWNELQEGQLKQQLSCNC